MLLELCLFFSVITSKLKETVDEYINTQVVQTQKRDNH